MLAFLPKIFLIGLFSLSQFAISNELPNLGNSARNLITPQQEHHIGQALLRHLHEQQQLINDPLLIDYIQQLGQRLAAPSSPQHFRFFILNQPSINAFAGPAGHIGIHAGLMLTSKTESELASVLAHEIAHITQHHLLQTWESAQTLSLPKAALTLAAIALGVASGSQAGLALAAGSQAALQQQQINYTRRHEQEADRIGIQLLAKAGFDPNAMAAFFTRVGQANRVYSSALPELLRSHPMNNQRTAEALDRAADYPYTQHQPDELGYHLAKVRLQRQQPRYKITLSELRQRLESGRYRNRLAAEYALVLALQDNQQGDAATPYRQNLLRKHPNQPEFIIAQAEYEVQQQRIPEALQRLQTAIHQTPNSLALAITHAEIALANNHAETAINQLQRSIIHLPEQPHLYTLLARAAGNLKKVALTHQYLAEYHAVQGDYTAAIQQLEQALHSTALTPDDRTRLQKRQQAFQAIQTEVAS
jgi:predicted Zn-dependent protease